MADTDRVSGSERCEKVLTGKQEEFLKRLDEEFKDRYTEADDEYKRVWRADLPSPPILPDFDKISDKNSDNYNRDRRQRRYYAHHFNK